MMLRYSSKDEIFQEVIAGIKTYFDKVLGNLLLYRFERQQYVDIRKKNNGKEDSEIYGGEHLLRLFGRSCPSSCMIVFTNRWVAK